VKFYEFNPNAYKTQDDVAKMAGSAVKTAATQGKSLVGSVLKGAAKFGGMFAKDFDPALKPFYQDEKDAVADKSKYNPKEIEEFKKVLADYLRSAPLYAPDKVILQQSLSKAYSEKMSQPEYKIAVKKILAGKQLEGKEVVLIKELVTEL
jgi:hypothetical protein